MKLRYVTLLILILFTCAKAIAQYPQVRNFTTNDYQGGTQNWCITKGPNQRLFFGNNYGVLAFDGKRWTLKYVANYSSVRAIFYDDESGRLYAGASEELGYFDTDTLSYSVRYHSLTPLLPKSSTFGEIWKIIKSGHDIIFQSKQMLLVYSEEQQKMRTVSNGQRIECSTLVNGEIVVACSDYAATLSASGLVPLKGTEPLKGKVVRTILSYGGQTLFVTSSDGILAYKGPQTMDNGQQTNEARLLPFDLPVTDYLKDNQVFCADIDGDNIAFGTVRGGLVMYNMKDHVAAYANTYTSLQNNTVLSVMFDQDHHLWLALDNGISYVMSDSPLNSLFSSASQTGTGYASAINGGRLYLGTSQGLFATPFPIAISPTPPQPQLLSGMTGQVWALTDIDGTLFCGNDNGAYIIRGTSAESIQGVKGTWGFEGGKDYIVGCDYEGFFVLKHEGTTWKLAHRINGIDVISGEFYVDEDGTLWICHWQKGIYHVRLSEDLTTVTDMEYFHNGNGLLLDEGNLLCRIDGKIYVSCVDGLYCYDSRTRKLVLDKQKSSIFDTYGTTLRILQSPYGDLWASKEGYLALSRQRTTSPLLTSPDGGRDNGQWTTDSLSFRYASHNLHLGKGAMYSLDSLHMLVASNNGYLVINTRQRTTDNGHRTKPYIRRVIGTNSTDTLLYQDILTSGENPYIRIPHTQNSIRIEFIETEYREENAVLYQCMLEGYDKDWSQQQTSTSKEYTHLSKGSYVFRVRAYNKLTGKTTETSLRIIILPAWYETWWAYCIYFLLFVLAVWWLLRHLKQRADRELVRVRQEQERQMKEQQQQFSLEQAEKERELIKLRAEQLEYDMKANASKLADSTMNLMRKNDMLLSLDTQMSDLTESVRREDPKNSITRKIKEIRRDIQQNINDDENWEKFEENFNLVYDNYMRKLIARFPDLKLNDRKLCAYLRMGLSSKEMASLLNTSTRSIETARYRLRKKLQMESGDNLKEFIQRLEDGSDD